MGETAQIVTVVSAVSTAIIAIVHAIGFYWGRRDLKHHVVLARKQLARAENDRFIVARKVEGHFQETKSKLDNVELNTNGNLTKMIERIEQLETALAKALATNHPDEKNKVIVDTITSGTERMK